MSTVLSVQKIKDNLETSRRGGHLWFFFREPIAGHLARRFGLWVDYEFDMKVEVFPKQGQLSGGPGSLIRVPFGIHRKTGERYGFINPDGSLLGTWRQQAEMLCDPQTVTLEMVRYCQRLEDRTAVHEAHASLPEGLRGIPLVEFISQYVDLRPIASGALGLCPFHNDQSPSFGVNSTGNYWHCFAGCGGGDIVSFWMKWRGLEHKQAVEELEELLKVGDKGV